MTEKKSNHRANVIRIGEILPHPNADKLEITHVEGYQIVIGKGNFKTGDLAVYIQPDSVVPQTPAFSFLWAAHLASEAMCKHVDSVIQTKTSDGAGNDMCTKCMATLINGETALPESRRRITVKRLRKEWSEGLLMPVSEFDSGANFDSQWRQQGDVVVFRNTVSGITSIPIGYDVSDLLGITHYVPEFDRETASNEARPRHKYPKTLKGWFFFLLYHVGFSRARKNLALETGFNFPSYDVDALKNNKRLIKEGDAVHVTEKIHGSNARYVVVDDVFYAGSHYQWKQKGDNVWWKAAKEHPEIEEWCFQHQGFVLYGEVGPTQKGFRYGAGDGETFFFAFDVYDPIAHQWYWPGNKGFATNVPVLYVGKFTDDVLKLADGKTAVTGATGVREGIVIRSLERYPVSLKVVSNQFLEGDSK